MKDSELRGLILQALYDVRHQQDFSRIPDDLEIPGLPMNNPTILKTMGNIADQLKQQNLIDWSEFVGSHRSGLGRITAFGIDVVEGTREAAISVTIDQSTNIHGSTNVIVGKGNVQNLGEIGKLNLAIDQAQATQREKDEAKSFLQRMMSNKLVVEAFKKVLGWESSG